MAYSDIENIIDQTTTASTEYIRLTLETDLGKDYSISVKGIADGITATHIENALLAIASTKLFADDKRGTVKKKKGAKVIVNTVADVDFSQV